MKQYLLFFLLLSHSIKSTTNHFQHNNLSGNQQIVQTKTFFTYYFWIKEFFKAYIHTLFINQDKINIAKISCCQCNTNMTAGYLYAFFISEINEPALSTLIPLLYKGSTKDITEFLLQMHKKYEITCVNCQEYYGWYIPLLEN